MTPPSDLFPLLIRLASHIFSSKPKKRQALGLINCPLQQSDIPDVVDHLTLSSHQVFRFQPCCFQCEFKVELFKVYLISNNHVLFFVSVIYRHVFEPGVVSLSHMVTTVTPANRFRRASCLTFKDRERYKTVQMRKF